MSVEGEIERLRDPDPVVRTRAARALVFRSSGSDRPRGSHIWVTSPLEPGDPRAVTPLLAAADDPAKNVRTAVARALAVIGHTAPGREAREQLRAALIDENWRVRFAAARAYSWLLNEPFEPLLPLLEHDQETLRWAVTTTIAGRCRGSFGHFFDLINEFRVRPLPEPFLLEALLDSCADKAPSVRRAAHKGLDPDHDERCHDALVQAMLRDPDGRVRASAASRLRGDARAISALLAALDDPYPWVQFAAIHSLGEIGAPSAVDPLIARLQARKRYLRRAAAAALARVGDERAVEPLISLYERSTDQRVRRDVLEALAQFRAR